MEVHTSLSAIVYQTVKLQIQEDSINVALDTNCPKPSYIHLGRSSVVFLLLVYLGRWYGRLSFLEMAAAVPSFTHFSIM